MNGFDLDQVKGQAAFWPLKQVIEALIAQGERIEYLEAQIAELEVKKADRKGRKPNGVQKEG